jgi:hypothetical protein
LAALEVSINCVTRQEINTLLDENAKHIDGDYTLWLAGDYNNLSNYVNESMPATITPVDPDWRSPFVGKTVPDVVAYMKATPKPPKPPNKRFCAVPTKEGLELGQILVCKSLGNESGIASDSEDSDESELLEEDRDKTPASTAEPGSLKELLQSHTEYDIDYFPRPKRDERRSRPSGHSAMIMRAYKLYQPTKTRLESFTTFFRGTGGTSSMLNGVRTAWEFELHSIALIQT